MVIQTISYKVTELLFNNHVEQESFEIHQYGIEVMVSSIINILLILFLGLIFHQLIESVLYCLLFWFIRKFCGGYHCETYFKCISLHVSLFLFYLLTYHFYEHIALYVYGIAFICFLFISPIQNKKRILSQNEHQRYKIISLLILISYILLSYITSFKSIIIYVIAIVTILMIVCIQKYEN